MDNLGMVFGNQWAQKQASRDGDKILGHVFGQARPRVEQQVQAASGLNSSMVTKLLPMLAPIVLGYLGKKMSGAGSAQVASSLEQERVSVKQNDGMFGQILDMLDGDDDKRRRRRQTTTTTGLASPPPSSHQYPGSCETGRVPRLVAREV